MNIWESVLVALEGIVANKMRAVLTMLGVIIGVGAVITMLALARGAREQTMQRIQQMGTNTLVGFFPDVVWGARIAPWVVWAAIRY